MQVNQRCDSSWPADLNAPLLSSKADAERDAQINQVNGKLYAIAKVQSDKSCPGGCAAVLGCAVALEKALYAMSAFRPERWSLISWVGDCSDTCLRPLPRLPLLRPGRIPGLTDAPSPLFSCKRDRGQTKARCWNSIAGSRIDRPPVCQQRTTWRKLPETVTQERISYSTSPTALSSRP